VALVDLGPLTYCALFTEVYRNPATLADFANAKAKAIFERHLKKSGSSNNIAVVVGWKTCKNYMAINFLVLCAISLLIGVMVGVLCHDANLGAALGGGLFALLGTVATLLALLWK
jgi:hypothetical protein